MAENKPVNVFKHGKVRASVWQHEGKHGVYYTITLQRSYEAHEKIQYSESFSFYDLWNIVRASADAYSFISKKKADARKKEANV